MPFWVEINQQGSFVCWCARGADDTRKPLNADACSLCIYRDESFVFAQILDQLCRVFELGLGAALVASRLMSPLLHERRDIGFQSLF
jgi:hypothetical protein